MQGFDACFSNGQSTGKEEVVIKSASNAAGTDWSVESIETVDPLLKDGFAERELVGGGCCHRLLTAS